MTLTDLRDGFRNDDQRRSVQAVVHARLADDREPRECRYLMRFWRQLLMPYEEVSLEELRLNVGGRKLAALTEPIGAIRSSHHEVDAWVAAAKRTFPTVEDRGYGTYRRGQAGASSDPAIAAGALPDPSDLSDR